MLFLTFLPILYLEKTLKMFIENNSLHYRIHVHNSLMDNRYRINSDDAISDSWLCALQSAHCFTFYFFVVFLAISSGWFQVSPSFFSLLIYLFLLFFSKDLSFHLCSIFYFLFFFRLFFFPVNFFPFSYQQTSLFFSNISIYHFLVPLVFPILPFPLILLLLLYHFSCSSIFLFSSSSSSLFLHRFLSLFPLYLFLSLPFLFSLLKYYSIHPFLNPFSLT